MNCVVLVGRITADPVLRYTGDNIPFVGFTVAVNKRYNPQNGGPTADFIDCVAWRNNAEYIGRFVKKGNLLCIRGSIATRTYTAQDGTSRKGVNVSVDDVKNLTPRPADGGQQVQQIAPPDPFADAPESSSSRSGGDYAPYSQDNARSNDVVYDPFSDD